MTIEWEKGTQHPPDVKPKPCPYCAGTGKKKLPAIEIIEWVNAGRGKGEYDTIFCDEDFLLAGDGHQGRIVMDDGSLNNVSDDGETVVDAFGKERVDKVRAVIRTVIPTITLRVPHLIEMIEGWGTVGIGVDSGERYAVLYLRQGHDLGDGLFALDAGDEYDQAVAVTVGLKVDPDMPLAQALRETDYQHPDLGVAVAYDL